MASRGRTPYRSKNRYREFLRVAKLIAPGRTHYYLGW